MNTSPQSVDRGTFFEDLSEGQVLESPYDLITRQDIADFARLSRDMNLLHVDAEFAKSQGLPDVIAHGAFVFSRATGHAYELGLLVKASATFKEAHLYFERYVHPGDRIKIIMQVGRLKALPRIRKGKVYLDVTVVNHEGITVLRDDWVAVVDMRPA